MRDLEFRVWSGEKMLSISEALASDLVGVQHNRADSFAVESYYDGVELMQFTGLKDSNGVKIFEGDILANHKQGPRKVIYPMNEDIACFGLESADGWKNTLQNADKLYSVIGNIYENPELLNQANKTH